MKLGWHALWARLQALVRRRRLERDLQAELEFHQAMQVERGNRRRLGNELRLREEMRAAWQFAWIEALGQDLRYAARSLRCTPGFTLGVVATLGLGIGVNTAIFSLAYGVLWKPLPYPDPDRIVELQQVKDAQSLFLNSGSDIAAARDQDVGLRDWAMYRVEQATLTGAGLPESLPGAEVEAGLLKLLGAKPIVGRLFDASDAHPGSAPVVLIGERLWREQLGERADVIGKPIQLEGKPYTVVGVLPAAFDFPGGFGRDAGLASHPEYWLPWIEKLEGWGDRDVNAVARLAPGVTLAQARRGLNLAMARLQAVHQEDKDWRFVAAPLRESMVGEVASTLWVMLGVVGAVLLIAAANIAALLMARAQRRARELATRAALGAGRVRILRQLLTETGVLLALGAGLGLALAELGIQWLRWQAPADLPRIGEVGMNWQVLGFTAGVALVVGGLFGLAPAWRASAPSLEVSLRQGAPALAGRGGRGRAALVSVQVALALVLLVGAGLLLKAFWRETATPLGFNPENVLTFSLTLPHSRYPDSAALMRFYDAVQQRLAVLPGVEAVATTNSLPLEGTSSTGYSLPDRPLKPHDDSQETEFNIVSADYFRALQIPVLAGRGFNAADIADTPPVAVINQAMARTVFAGKNPIGQRIRFSWGKEPWRTVIGVVADARPVLGDQPAAIPVGTYVPLAQRDPFDSTNFVVRTKGDPAAVVPSVRRAVAALDPEIPLEAAVTMRSVYRDAVADPRFRGGLVAGFAGLALLLTAVGLYGLLSFSVGGRTREFGVRSALGAQPGQVMALVLRQAGILLGVGQALGLAGAWAATRLLAGLLYGVSPTDPWVLSGMAITLAAVGLAAAWGPARRATSVDAAEALRCE